MTKQSILLFLILFVLTISTYSQNFRLEAPPGYNFIYSEQNLPKNLEGSPYLDEWKNASILFRNGQTIASLPVRFNVYYKQMHYLDKNTTYVIGAPDSIAEIRLPERTFIYLKHSDDISTDKNFYEVIRKGRLNLLVKYETKVIYSNYNVALAVGDKNDKLTIVEHMYLLLNSKLEPVGKEKMLIGFLEDKKEQVSAFIKKEKISSKKKEDMIKLVDFYNQI